MCGKTARERCWKTHRQSKSCKDAKAADVLTLVKQEAPPPATPATAQTFAGSPFVYTPAAPGPPRTELPKSKVESKAEPKTKSAIGKQPMRRDSILASIARMSKAAAAKCEAQEAEAGPSSVAAPAADDEVECTGERTRKDRDAELRKQAVDVDSD